MYESSKVKRIVHFPLNVQVLEKNFWGKSCSFSKTNTKQQSKNQICSHNIYMRHRRSFVHQFFLSMYKFWEKISGGKIISLVKSNTQLL